MTIVEYEIEFISWLAGHLYSTSWCVRFCCLILGLRCLICMSTQSLVVVGRYLFEVSNHAQVVEKVHRQAYEVTN